MARLLKRRLESQYTNVKILTVFSVNPLIKQAIKAYVLSVRANMLLKISSIVYTLRL